MNIFVQNIVAVSWILTAALDFIVNQRPTAKELLKHRFITRTAKKNTYLVELIERYKNWKQKCQDDDDSSSGEENDE